MKKTTVLLFVMLMVIQGQAEENRITGFLPDSLTTWQVKWDMTGYFNSLNQDENSRSHADETVLNEIDKLDDNSSISLSPGATLYYQYIRPQREIFCTLLARYNYTQTWEDNDYDNTQSDPYPYQIREREYNSKNTQPLISAETTLNEYLRNNFGVSVIGSYDADYDRNNLRYLNKEWRTYDDHSYQYNLEKNQYDENTVSTALAIRGFHGRIYDGRYAAKAMEIIDQLENDGMLKRSLSDREFNDFSQIVMRHMASYHFDNRIKTIEALTDIYNFLESVGALNEEKQSAFPVIQDIYRNTPLNISRNFGTRTYLRLNYEREQTVSKYDRKYQSNEYKFYFGDDNEPLIDSVINESDSHYSSSQKTIAGMPSVEMGLEHNAILNWHLWYSTAVVMNYSSGSSNYYRNSNYNSSESEIDTESNLYESSITLNATLNYQPSSRSYCSVSVSPMYFNYQENEGGLGYKSYKTLNEYLYLTVSPRFQYYFTPKISFSVSGTTTLSRRFYRINSVDSNDEKYQYKSSEKYIQNTFNFGFVVYL